jgi:hypothetical protein
MHCMRVHVPSIRGVHSTSCKGRYKAQQLLLESLVGHCAYESWTPSGGFTGMFHLQSSGWRTALLYNALMVLVDV